MSGPSKFFLRVARPSRLSLNSPSKSLDVLETAEHILRMGADFLGQKVMDVVSRRANKEEGGTVLYRKTP